MSVHKEQAATVGVLAAAAFQFASLLDQVRPPVAFHTDAAYKQVAGLSAVRQRKPSGVAGLQAHRFVVPWHDTPEVAQRVSSPGGATPQSW